MSKAAKRGLGLLQLLAALFFFTISLPSLAFANEICHAVFHSDGIFGVKKEDALGLLGHSDYRNHLRSHQALLENLRIPPVTLRVHEPGTHGYIHLHSVNGELLNPFPIDLPSLFPKYKSGRSSHPKHMLGYLSHEYGHAVFEINMRAQSALFLQWREEDRMNLQERSVLEDLKNSEEARIRESLPKKAQTEGEEASPALIFRFDYPELMAIDKELKKTNQQDFHSRRRASILSAYHELFADAIAAIRFGDPRILSDLFTGDSVISKPEHVEASHRVLIRRAAENRRLDKVWGISAWKDWRRDLERTVDHSGQSQIWFDPYLFFAPARAGLWKAIQNRVKNPESRKTLLAELMEVLRIHFETSFSDPGSLEGLNPTELNRSLIHLFEERWT